MPQKERPRKNRYRNTSDLSNEVQRANASGNVPRQNLKRREAAFLLGATAFRTREMQKCASPFVEVRQIEFLARETPNYITTNLHTPHQWTCESVAVRISGNVATRKRPQRRYDQSHDRDGTAGVPSTQPALVREPTSAFSVRGGGSSCHLCSTPRSRGRERPED